MTGLLKRWLAHPLTRGMSLDDPQTTARRRRIVESKPFLRRLYTEWYQRVAEHFPPGAVVLELGSGAGFLEQFIPGLITSDLFGDAGAARTIDAQAIDMPDASLDGIVLTDVLHHIPDCEAFFRDAARVVRRPGAVVMIEPWNTPWARWVYQRLHHEPFDPSSRAWTIPSSGPLSGANGALPWIVFERDREAFDRRHPQWRVERVTPFMPMAYLLSGGVSLRSLAPGWAYHAFRRLERMSGLEVSHAMFALIILRRI